MKPILYIMDQEPLKFMIDEWTALILDTYKKLKKDSTMRQAYSQNHPPLEQRSKPLINYSGELEIRGLIVISYYALYYHDQLDMNIKYRVSKLTTILTREIVERF